VKEPVQLQIFASQSDDLCSYGAAWWRVLPAFGRTFGRVALLAGIVGGGGMSAEASGAPGSDTVTSISFGGPSSIVGQLEADRKTGASLLDVDRAARPIRDLTDRLNRDYGVRLGLDYNALYQHASESLDKQNAAGGVLRFYGTAQVFDQASGHPGAIEFKVENRHRLGTDISPSALAGQIGYAGLTAVPFSDAGTILTNLYWHQALYENRLAYILGIVDVTDYVGVYGLVNPWTDFINLAFSTDPTIPAPDQGLGAGVRWTPARNYYFLAGLAGANSDPHDPAGSIDSFFEDGEYFTHVEAGWYGEWESRFEDNIHLTLWQADERTEAGIPDGWGAAFSLSKKLDEWWLPFVRIGYADGGGALLERSVSAGFARYSSNKKGVLGLGLNWGQPNRETFGTVASDQYTLEAYYRLQIVDNLAVTPDIQLIKNPALNADDDLIWVVGLRARLAF